MHDPGSNPNPDCSGGDFNVRAAHDHRRGAVRLSGGDEARIRRGDQQKVFAYRIGVSIPTLRDLEEGKPTVSIGAFMNALEAVGHLEDMTVVMAGVSADKKRVRKTARHSLSQ